MALSSQGGLNFQQSRLQDSTESARGALTEFGSLAQKFQDNKLKAEALAEAKAQQALENKRADEMMAMRKSEFDTAQNTLRATTQGATTLDSAAVGNALLDKQAATIGGSDGNGNFNSKLLQESQALAAKYQPVTNADGTSTAVAMSEPDATRFDAIQKQLGAQADKMITANKGNMQTQKQLIGEVGNQYFKEGQDGPMLYDPTSLNKYKQDLLSGLDTRIDREATRAQQAELERARLAQDAKQHNDRMRQQKQVDDKLLADSKKALEMDLAARKVLTPTVTSKNPVYEKRFGTEVVAPLNANLKSLSATKKEATANYVDVYSSRFKDLGLGVKYDKLGNPSVYQKNVAPVKKDIIDKVFGLKGAGGKVDKDTIDEINAHLSKSVSAYTERHNPTAIANIALLQDKVANVSSLYKPARNADGSRMIYGMPGQNLQTIVGSSYTKSMTDPVRNPEQLVQQYEHIRDYGKFLDGTPATSADLELAFNQLGAMSTKVVDSKTGSAKTNYNQFSK